MRGGDGRTEGPDAATRDLPVPLHARLAAALEAEIRDGVRMPGEPLPAARRLADRLGMHRHTVAAAYARLEARGLVRKRAGHPPIVRDPEDRVDRRRRDAARDVAALRPPDRDAVDPGAGGVEWIAWALASARREGVSRRETLRGLREGLNVAARNPRVTLYEPRPGLRAVLAAELGEELRLRLRVARAPRGGTRRGRSRAARARPPGAPRAGPPRASPGSGVALLRAELWLRLGARLPEIEKIPIRLSGGGREVDRILRRLPRPGVVALLTRSRTVRAFATELAASARGHGVALAAPDPADRPAVERAARVAALLLADASCSGAVPPTRAPVRRLRLVAGPELARLRAYFREADAPRPPGAQRREGEPAG